MSLLLGSTRTVFLFLYFLILGIVAATTPISPSEASLFFQEKTTPTIYLMHLGDSLIPHVLGLRLFFLILGALNASLFYVATAMIFRRPEDRWLALFFYLILPGVIVSTVLANDAVLIAFLVLLFLYLYQHQKLFYAMIPLFALSFVHWSALYFYVILILYGLFQKEKFIFLGAVLALLLFALLGVSLPESSSGNYLFETLGIDATIFSPLLFGYLFYALYRTLLRGERTLLWYISFGALVFSLLLSLQQRIKITDFSAYLMLGIAVAVQTYLASLKVRLKRFRKNYNIAFWIVTFSLLLSSLTMLLHQPIYRLLGPTYYPVVHSVYMPHDRAMKLKAQGKKCVNESKAKVLYQMRYYGLEKCF